MEKKGEERISVFCSGGFEEKKGICAQIKKG